ncbi:hypothetical protein [Nocardia sp. SYP-A9097]|uniref:hypothetical protein n=1 Tax=Nocardia sp. SYP-A9097 TaxID=2663237 RepID=UPI00129A6815|nr:hypothetical protein [Nocardia sp. SYP-A9097]
MRGPFGIDWFRWSDLRDTVATHIAVVTDDDERASAQLGHIDGKRSMAQEHYIEQGIRRLTAVDNADVLELLNPFFGESPALPQQRALPAGSWTPEPGKLQ